MVVQQSNRQSDLPIATDLPHRHPNLVLRGGYPARVGSKRRMVAACWRLLSQHLVWPLGVVAVTKGVKDSLLPAPGRLGWTGRLCLERAVQPFQSSVLFRVARLGPFRHDAQLDPPNRQRREASQNHTRKGRFVVGPDGPRQSVLPKGTFEDLAHLRPVGLPAAMRDAVKCRSPWVQTFSE